jgi:RNA polymerase sigma-70 factor (ECF subfamily)
MVINHIDVLKYQDDFLRMQPRLFALAYKMTKSVVDAEDIVQETFLAMNSVKAGSIREPEAYFIRAVTNRCLKVLDQRKATIYPGPDLPEPLEDGFRPEAVDPDLSYGLLLLLQHLKPVERAIFILRESFGLEYGAIAGIVDSNPDNCRQMLHRAKGKLNRAWPVRRTSEERVAEIMQVFLAAATSGDSRSLITLLREDVTVYSDGGGKRPAALHPVKGPMAVLKYMMGIYNKWSEGFSLSVVRVNGEPAIVLHHRSSGLPDSVTFFNFEETGLAAIYTIRNPDKLRGVQSRAI